jgi:large subunit ribosomal protein L31
MLQSEFPPTRGEPFVPARRSRGNQGLRTAVGLAGKEHIVKEGIHPAYKDVEVRCACGNTFKTRSTKPELHLEICSACHPFFTGRQKLIDTEGRVERFSKKFGAQTSEQRKVVEKAAKAAKAAAAKKAKPTSATT